MQIRQSIPGRAIKAGLVEVVTHDLRDYTEDKHKTVDDTPYGGGAGMIFKPEPLAKAIGRCEGRERCAGHLFDR